MSSTRLRVVCNHAVDVDGIKRASACMILRRLDYIQSFGLITYRSSSGLHPALRADYIHGFAVIEMTNGDGIMSMTPCIY